MVQELLHRILILNLNQKKEKEKKKKKRKVLKRSSMGLELLPEARFGKHPFMVIKSRQPSSSLETAIHPDVSLFSAVRARTSPVTRNRYRQFRRCRPSGGQGEDI